MAKLLGDTEKAKFAQSFPPGYLEVIFILNS